MIYVDQMLPCVPNRSWCWRENSHLFVVDEPIEALHAFALRLGLKRSWFQAQNSLPHYDLTRGKWRQAIKLGAVLVERSNLLEIHGEARRTATEARDAQD